MPFNTSGDVWNISADHIAQSEGSYEPQRANHFMLTIPNLPGGGTEILRLSLQTAFAPIETTEAVEIPFINEVMKVAGRTTVEQGTVTFVDYVDPETGTALFYWRRMVYDNYTGRIGLARDYKRDALLQLFGPAGGATREWSLRGCWPSSVNWAPTLDYNSSEINRIEVTIVFDKVFPLNEGTRTQLLHGWTMDEGGEAGRAGA